MDNENDVTDEMGSDYAFVFITTHGGYNVITTSSSEDNVIIDSIEERIVPEGMHVYNFTASALGVINMIDNELYDVDNILTYLKDNINNNKIYQIVNDLKSFVENIHKRESQYTGSYTNANYEFLDNVFKSSVSNEQMINLEEMTSGNRYYQKSFSRGVIREGIQNYDNTVYYGSHYDMRINLLFYNDKNEQVIEDIYQDIIDYQESQGENTTQVYLSEMLDYLNIERKIKNVFIVDLSCSRFFDIDGRMIEHSDINILRRLSSVLTRANVKRGNTTILYEDTYYLPPRKGGNRKRKKHFYKKTKKRRIDKTKKRTSQRQRKRKSQKRQRQTKSIK